MGEFLMPSLGADMEDGTLVEWLKQPGDRIRRGDVIAVVETEKGAIEIDVFEDGVIERLLVDIGAKVPVGAALALIDGEVGAKAAAQPPRPPPPVGAKPIIQPPPQPLPASPIPTFERPAGTRAMVSPAARRLASERGIALASVRGSGPDGAIVYRDVELAAAAQPSPPRRGFDFAEMRRAIAAAMTRSKREIPHYYLGETIDVGRALEWLEARNAVRPPPQRLMMIALLAKAVARALGKSPELNGFYTDQGFQASADINVGVAIALRGGGLIAPAIRAVQGLTLDDLMARLRDLIGRARTGQLRSSELSTATITVTSLGDRGVETVFGAIYPPQVALVGFGTPSERPWVVDGQVVPRRLMTATLAADHRVSDGHGGGLFLAEIGKRLQQPEAL
jgi:pyruvate dehydrogenase E2 component (dihydrolipoamide acetyltransferase)